MPSFINQKILEIVDDPVLNAALGRYDRLLRILAIREATLEAKSVLVRAIKSEFGVEVSDSDIQARLDHVTELMQTAIIEAARRAAESV